MPTVHNGIGTWYYGKQRIHRFKSGCSFCKRVVELESYDTTLYLAVFFVPIIPLRRKRVREQLALTLLKEGRPQDAEPYLRHILDQRLKEDAGMLFLLVEGYQAQGMHGEALALMDRRDAAFPEFAHSKDYQKQRRISEKYQNTDKRIASAFLSESGKTGYREGGM